MAYRFEPDDPHDQMNEVLDDFDRLRDSKNKSRKHWFRQAMADLLGIEVSLAAERAVDSDEFANFKHQVAERLREHAYEFRAFRNEGDSAAESPREDWYEACFVRSVVQIFLDNYQDTGIAELIDPARIQEFDDLLHEFKSIAPPLPPQLIPPGLPESHWWWTAPTGEPLTFDEYGVY